MVTYTKTLELLRGDLALIAADIKTLLTRTAPIPSIPPVVQPSPASATPAVPAPAPTPSPAIYTRSRPATLPAIINMPFDLAQAKQVLPFALSNAIKPDTYPTYPRGDYKSVGLTRYMPTTGERQEIGLVTEAQAAWLCGGSPDNMLTQAAAHADVPVHFGKVDLRETPWATTYGPGKGSPYFAVGGYAVTPETAHYPSLSYIPYLATGDIFYLEELQAAATFVLISGPGVPGYRPLLDGGQPRGLAWTLREVAQAYIATMEAEKSGPLPDGLLPSSYWKGRLDVYRDALTAKYVNSPDPRVQAFRNMIVSFEVWIAPWEQDYLGAVLGWMVWTGRLDDWRPIYEWQAQQAIRRAEFGAKAIGYHWTVGAATDYASLLADAAEVKDSNYKAFWRGNLKIAVMNLVAGAAEAFAVADALPTDYRPRRWAV